MSNTKEKKFLKLKNQHTWSSIVISVITFTIIFAIINVAVIFFMLYSIDSKVDDEYKIVRQIADIYLNSHNSDVSFEKIAESNGYEYFVRDADGTVIDGDSVNTCSENGGEMGFVFGKRNYTVYEDTEEDYLVYDSAGMVVLNLRNMHWTEDRIAIDGGGTAAGKDDETVIATGYADMPLWIGVPLNDNSTFIVKGHIRVRISDFFVLLTIFIAMNIIMLFFMIFRIIRIVGEFSRRRKITELFLVDEVTRGNNRMAFMLKGNQILRKSKNADKRYAVMHLTIVKFRNFCMCHTPEEGNNILVRISAIISQNLITYEELLAHVSSSSFALLMEAPTDDAVRQRFSTLLDRLNDMDMRDAGPMMAGHTQAYRSFQFQAGVQIIEPNIIEGKKKKRKDTGLEHFYNNAVTAKSTLESTADSGIAFFDEKLLEDERWAEMVEEYQQKALDNEEFVVYYQPKYSPDTEELVGAEALIRWQSPEFGFVPPGRFIPIFENNGFITSIDHYMICHVARDQKNWLDAGMKCVPVSVNVSRAHFAESDLAEQIRNMVDEVGTPHEFIEIELTESAFFDDKNAIIESIERLKSYGFSVSMDDFGSGYSSLNSLKDMDLDVLKLDAEFFRGDADPERKAVVISEAINLAKRLNMRTVAEGVEEKDEVDFLSEQGCDMIQGYYFSKPLPKDEYESRMDKRETDTQNDQNESDKQLS